MLMRAERKGLLRAERKGLLRAERKGLSGALGHFGEVRKTHLSGAPKIQKIDENVFET